jgi:hypothetical protein
MPAILHLRGAVKELLQGIALPRPLFLPIVFSLGARVENVPLRAFLSNPTKISNALRQVHTRLRADGVTCYYDPFLEAEALGGELVWKSDDGPAELRWPRDRAEGELPGGLRSPEEAVRSGRIPVAVEVIQRLRGVLRDGALLVAAVTGPFSLAARLASGGSVVTSTIAQTAGAAMVSTAQAFAQAGADVILIHERVLPKASPEVSAEVESQLSAAINIIRFYGALPIHLLTATVVRGEGGRAATPLAPTCIQCGVIAGGGSRSSFVDSARACATSGIALPWGRFISDDGGSDEDLGTLCGQIREMRPSVVTTDGDFPLTGNMKRLVAICEMVRS